MMYMFNNASIDQLRLRYPWPSEKPNVLPTDWSLDGGGKELVINKIRSAKLKCVVEIGVFFGGSVRTWVMNTVNTIVIAADPWTPAAWWAEYAVKHGREELAMQLKAPQGPYETFLSSLWDFRDRVIPVNSSSPSILHELSDVGVKPDLFFFDSDKTGDDLEVAHKLFPEAVLTGDDWTWGKNGVYPIRKAVKEFCLKYNYTYRYCGATWVIDFESVPLKERVTLPISRLRKVFSALSRRHKMCGS